MSQVMKDLENTFTKRVCKILFKQDADFVRKGIFALTRDVLPLPEGTEFDMYEWANKNVGEERRGSFVAKVMPYMIGFYGPLDLIFQTEDGETVPVCSVYDFLHQPKSPEVVTLPDGRTIASDKVVIQFRRNSKQ